MLAQRSDVSLFEERWSILNNNRAARQAPDLANYYALLAAIDGGWQVEVPVYIRSDWSLSRKDELVFHFVLVLQARRMTTLLSVPDCDLVRRLISDNNWQIDPPQ
jgi:hypothetical protein